MATNVPLPTYNLPPAVREFAENMLFFDGVGELEAMLRTEGDSLERRWPPEAVLIARGSVQLSGGMVLNHHRLKSGDLRSSAKADWGRHHGSTLKSASWSRSGSS